MHTAIYLRVSTEEQATEGFSIKAQKDKLTKYAQANDYVIAGYYIDDGISGKNLKDRKEVMRLINDVKSGKIKNVLVYKLDRLTRSLKDLIYLIELFSSYNCSFNSQTEKLDTSNAVGRMFVKIIGTFAEFERENLAERVTLGYEQKTKEGNYTNTNGVFGYNYITGKGILEVNNLESIYVRKIYEWYLNGDSMLGIAKKLSDESVPTKRGGNWNQSTIYSILTNPLYIGTVRYGVNKKNSFHVKGKNVESILDESIYKNVQELMKKRKKFHNKKHSSDDTYYFRVLKCAKCGMKYHARQQIQSNKKYITYICNGRYSGICDARGFSHKKLEQTFLKYLDKINNLNYDENILNKKLFNNNEINLIKEEINRLTIKKSNMVKSFVEDKINLNSLNEIQHIIDEKMNNLKDQLKDLENKSKEEYIDKKQIKELNIKNNFLYLTNKERKIFIERFIKEIKVIKEGNDVKILNILF